MQNFISRILDGLTAGLLRQAERLVRLAAARHLVGEYQAAYDDVTVLEASGKKQLAEFLRSELDEALDGSVTSATAAEAAPLSLNGAGDRGPFVALSGPGASAAVAADPSATPAAAAAKEPAKRRGRPRKASSNGRKSKRATKAAVETIESTTLTGD